MRKRARNRWVSEDFARELDNIKLERIKTGVDKKIINDARITDSLIKDLDFEKIKRRLIKLPRKEDIK